MKGGKKKLLKAHNISAEVFIHAESLNLKHVPTMYHVHKINIIMLT